MLKLSHFACDNRVSSKDLMTSYSYRGLPLGDSVVLLVRVTWFVVLVGSLSKAAVTICKGV